jgi:hypothetical protein
VLECDVIDVMLLKQSLELTRAQRNFWHFAQDAIPCGSRRRRYLPLSPALRVGRGFERARELKNPGAPARPSSSGRFPGARAGRNDAFHIVETLAIMRRLSSAPGP